MYLVICNAHPDHSKAIARQLVNDKLAACVNLIPNVLSFYIWKDRFVEDNEDTLLIKVRKDRYEEFEKKLTEIHPYSSPEILAIEPTHVLDSYLKWIYEVT